MFNSCEQFRWPVMVFFSLSVLIVPFAILVWKCVFVWWVCFCPVLAHKISFHFQMRVCVNVQIWFIEIVCIEHVWGFSRYVFVLVPFIFISLYFDHSHCDYAVQVFFADICTHNIEKRINVIQIEIEWQNLFVLIFHLDTDILHNFQCGHLNRYSTCVRSVFFFCFFLFSLFLFHLSFILPPIIYRR